MRYDVDFLIDEVEKNAFRAKHSFLGKEFDLVGKVFAKDIVDCQLYMINLFDENRIPIDFYKVKNLNDLDDVEVVKTYETIMCDVFSHKLQKALKTLKVGDIVKVKGFVVTTNAGYISEKGNIHYLLDVSSISIQEQDKTFTLLGEDKDYTYGEPFVNEEEYFSDMSENFETVLPKSEEYERVAKEETIPVGLTNFEFYLKDGYFEADTFNKEKISRYLCYYDNMESLMTWNKDDRVSVIGHLETRVIKSEDDESEIFVLVIDKIV